MVLNECGRVDVTRIAEILDTDTSSIIDDLGPAIYLKPGHQPLGDR